MKRIALFLGAVALALGLVSLQASARPLQDIIKSGTLRVGINPTLPPLGKFDEKNEVVGFDVDFSTRIAQMLGVKLEIVNVGSADRIPFVVSDKIDFVMGAMTRNPERAKTIDFTFPVHTEVFGVLTTEGKPYKSYKDLDDAAVTLVQVRGTTPVKFAEDNVPKAKVLLLDNYPDAIRALAQGRGDAMIDVIDFVGEHMNKYPNAKWKLVDAPVDVYYCSLGVAKGNESLRDWLNVAIFELHRRGVVDEAWKKWFGVPMFHDVKTTPYF
jgi:polar amino acid transport system substrate-binding protein